MSDVGKRAGRNEALLRQVNESIQRGQWPGERDQPVRFRCECAQSDCNQTIELTIQEYEQIREYSRHFAVRQGHEVPEHETVVASHPGYVVVEKREEAAVVADRLDPRS
ncbi:MAG: hypothetical protein ACYC91_05500 [Solirubrobacteraceae bacterium]